MPARVEPFINGYWYHIFNRGVDHSSIFRNALDYHYFENALTYYRYYDISRRFSKYISLPDIEKHTEQLELENHDKYTTVSAFAYMPNHFHILARQDGDDGIHIWLSKTLNSYSKYINKKHHRLGPVYQGNFRAVRIETDEQFLHVSRYIHLNPVVAGMISIGTLVSYPWTSYPIYMGAPSNLVDISEILGLIGSKSAYSSFVENQVDYAKTLAEIRHLGIDNHLGGGHKGEDSDGPEKIKIL